MFHIRDQNGLVRNGFNFYPLSSSLFGFAFIWGDYTLFCYWIKRQRRLHFGRF